MRNIVYACMRALIKPWRHDNPRVKGLYLFMGAQMHVRTYLCFVFSNQLSIVDLEGLNDAPFFELVKKKLLEAPWNLNVHESSTWKVTLYQ